MLTISDPIDVDRQNVFSRIGYADDYQPSARIESLVNDYIENCHDLLSSSFSSAIRKVTAVEGNSVTIEGSVRFESRVIARLLQRCEKVAVFATTIGSYLEDMVAYLAENGMVLQATVLDAIGSGAAERSAAFVEEHVRCMAATKGLKASRRFSPGYCDWEVGQQKMVFKALGGDSAGVRLTDTCLMIPRKSVSGIVGLGGPEVEDYNPCRACKKVGCPGRRE